MENSLPYVISFFNWPEALNKNITMSSLKSSGNIQKKEDELNISVSDNQFSSYLNISVSDNQFSSVTLNELK